MEKHLKLLESYLFFIWQTMSFKVPVIKTQQARENFQMILKHKKLRFYSVKKKKKQDPRLNMP
jgi:hypothetical protein